jgi:hypothetical protein
LDVAVARWTEVTPRGHVARSDFEGTLSAVVSRMPSDDPRSPEHVHATSRMVMVVFRNSLQSDVFAVLRDLQIEAYTNLPEVYGAGLTGGAFHSLEWRGANEMILVALDERLTARLVEALGALRQRVHGTRKHATNPLRAFVLPCLQAV